MYDIKDSLPSGLRTVLIGPVRGKAALVGEIAVPCNLQPATAGMNSGPRSSAVLSDLGEQ